MTEEGRRHNDSPLSESSRPSTTSNSLTVSIQMPGKSTFLQEYVLPAS